MNQELLGENQNLNVSGFNDDSIISDADDLGRHNSNFLIKSNTSKGLEKEIKKANYSHTDSIQSNFEIMSPDIDINNPKNNVRYEELFNNTFVIPMDYPSKFSISKMGHQFTYESNSKITNYEIDSKKFAISKNSQIMTYLLNLFVFSEFLNLEEVERDKRIKVFFIKKNHFKKKFLIENTNSILNSLEIPNDKANEFETFINGINDFLSKPEYLNIQTNNKKKLIYHWAIIIIISLLILGICISMLFTIFSPKFEMKAIKAREIVILVLGGIALLLFGFGLVYKIIVTKNFKLLFIYYDLRYLLINYNILYEHIDTWNKNLFENYKIRAIVPISLNYIMFNLNPYQSIEIKHLNMDEMKKKFYKSPKDLFKTQKEIKLFNSIKQNMFQNSRNTFSSYSSIN
jgi:hypothetical protein